MYIYISTPEISVKMVSLFHCGEYIALGTFSTSAEETLALCVYGLMVKVYTKELVKWL